MEKLNTILCDVFRLKKDELKDELTMKDIKIWDSLTHMDLITSIEAGLNIQLSMKDIKTIKNIVQEKLA